MAQVDTLMELCDSQKERQFLFITPQVIPRIVHPRRMPLLAARHRVHPFAGYAPLSREPETDTQHHQDEKRAVSLGLHGEGVEGAHGAQAERHLRGKHVPWVPVLCTSAKSGPPCPWP